MGNSIAINFFVGFYFLGKCPPPRIYIYKSCSVYLEVEYVSGDRYALATLAQRAQHLPPVLLQLAGYQGQTRILKQGELTD